MDRFRISIISLLIIGISVLAYGVGKLNQTADSSNRFLANFSNYMHCLVVTDQPALAKLGKDAYFAECDKLLFKGTGMDPIARKPVPTTTVTTK